MALGGSAGSNGPWPALPVDERARLLGDGRDGEHDVGAFGDGAVAQLQADDERRGVDGGQRGRRVGQVVDLDAADEQRAAASPSAAAARMPAVSRPGAPGRSSTSQAAATSRAGGGIRDRPAAGQQVRRRTGFQRAAVTGPARDPAQPGARSPRPAGSPPNSAPGELASRSPTRMTVPARAVRRRSASSAAASPPGAVGDRAGRPSSSRPRVANGAIDVTAQPALADGLAQPQEDDRRLLLGFEPGEQYGGRRFEVGVGDGHRLPGDGGGQELAPPRPSAARLRKSMSLVPSTIRANLA